MRHEGPAGTDPAPDDARLLAATAGGDAVAFAALYDRYAGRCYSLAWRVTVDPSLAQDAVQEAFLAVWLQAGEYTAARGRPGTWLVTLVHHKAVDLVRRESRFRRREDRAEDLTGWITAMGVTPPDEHAWTAHRRDRLIAALAALTHVQREVLVLAYFGGFSYPEIAAITGVPVGTIKTRAHAAVRRIRTQLADLTD